MYRNKESEKTTDLNNRIEHIWKNLKTRLVHGQAELRIKKQTFHHI